MKLFKVFFAFFICINSYAEDFGNTYLLNNPQAYESEPLINETEQWSLRGQLTYVAQQKNNFRSSYSGSNSLLNASEGSSDKSYTLSATAYLGARLWEGAELFYNYEMFEGTPFGGQLTGLGGIQNGELQKGSFAPPVYYTARAFVRQSFNFGGEQEYIDGDINSHLAGYVDRKRLVINYGKFASLDFFDKNIYSHETRENFLNFAIFSMGAYGYGADAKGFTYGVVGELYHDDWVLRAGRLAIPATPNQLDLDYSLTQDYIDQVELTHNHKIGDKPGAVRFLLFQQHALMATYQGAINQYYQQPSLGPPNILTVRFNEQNMWGYGLNIEQAITKDIGLFARWSWNSGNTETQTLDVNSSLSGGISIKGPSWGRSEDTIGLGYAINGLSAVAINYLQLGGMTMFIGDGAMSYKPEQIFEAYYSYKVYKKLYLTADYQYISNPAYNSDRGPIHFLGFRAHLEM